MDAQDQEERLVVARRGKWSRSGVPHRGWHCVDIEDLGSPQVECGMCESQNIRYVHHMEHPAYPEVLEVGCVCAGHMEEDVAAARTREASMKSREGKRKRWLTRKWKISKNGNPWLSADGYRVVVSEKQSGWAATVTFESTNLPHHSRRTFKTIEEAKLAAFDHVTRLLAKNA